MATTWIEVASTVVTGGSINVAKYKSNRTGLLVYLADVQGPLVHGYFCLATETHDDDGLPHTLEHLIFMGSEDYPYKGMLELLASRSLASGTNAWTDVDHTYYTLNTAGSQGFLNMLPVFLDHILYPTLTEFGYMTEVYHVNGNGEDAGVVYCEVQANENSGENLTQIELLRSMYPGHCGYKSATGGLMKNLRESTSHEKVCSYHKQFYRPENLCLIITGQITAEEVFKVLQPFEEKILSRETMPRFSQPWQLPVPRLPESVVKVVEYPADDESHGIVIVGWRGPPAKDQYTCRSVSVLLDYLANSAISPLQINFVATSDPYSSGVHGNLIENSESCIYIKFDSVLKTKLHNVYPRLQELIRNTGSETIDVARMNNLIQRKVLDTQSSMEVQPQKTLASALIGDFLHGDTIQDLVSRVHTVEIYKRMKKEPEQYWVGLISRYFIDKQYVLVVGEPSRKEKEQLVVAENERVMKQRGHLGTDGLKQKAKELQRAVKENERKAPEGILTSLDIPNVDSIHLHSIRSHCNTKFDESSKEANIHNKVLPLDNIPYRFKLDDVHTNFVQMHVLMDSSGVPQDLKYFLPLFCEAVLECPILRDGTLLPYEEVVSQIQADTLSTESCLGVNGGTFKCGKYPQLVFLKLHVEREKYNLGVEWLREILYQTKFPAERLKVVARRMRNDISKCKRIGIDVLHTLIRSILFSNECNHQVNSMLRQRKFLDTLLEQLENDPQEVYVVEESMDKVRRLLTHPDNIAVHMSADVTQLPADFDKLAGVWSTLLPTRGEHTGSKPKCVMKKTYDNVIPLSKCLHRSLIIGLGSLETSYLIQAVECVNSYMHEDLPAIMVFVQYLVQMEGPMWKQIRGRGLSYNIRMYADPESGQLYFMLARSAHIASAYKEGRDIVMKHVNGETELNALELDSAKGSLIYKVIEQESTVSDAIIQSLLSHLMEVPHTYSKDILRKISKMTLDDISRVGVKYIAALFDEKRVRRAVCCNPSKVGGITQSLNELGMEVEEVLSLDENFICAL